jgi:predicted  nucleic acid-binding Zn-ribbon protein
MASRQEYIQSLHRKIDEWNEEIDTLSVQKDRLEAESKLELQKQIDLLKSKRSDMELQLEHLKTTGAEAWEDVKSGVDLAWEAMNLAITSAVSRFSK